MENLKNTPQCMTIIKKMSIIVISVLLAACASSTSQVKDANDPLESMNRATFKFNTTLDKYALKPVAQGYQKVVPSVGRRGISNMFDNIHGVTVFAHDTLQLKPKLAITTLHRLVFNTVFGLGGLIDLTETFHLAPAHDNDFGMTLVRYGWSDSAFLVLPFFGPSTVRDGIGIVGDTYLDPLNYTKTKVRNPMGVLGVIDLRSQFLDLEKVQNNAALDAYIFQREAYKGIRNAKLFKAGLLSEEELQKLNSKSSELDGDGSSIQDMLREKRQKQAQ